MLKLVGSVLILLTCTAIGYVFSKNYRDRPVQIREWITALKIMETEIMYNATPMQLLSRQLADQLAPPCALFFGYLHEELTIVNRNMVDAWELAMEKYGDVSSLKRKEKTVLRQFGHTLGKYNRKEQEKHIQLTLKHLEKEEADARDEQLKYEKMYRSLGFLMGLFIVLLLF